MIEVGKIVTREPITDSYSSCHEENVTVGMDERSVVLIRSAERGSRSTVQLSSAQAIELGQLLLKAAECQPDYAEAAKELEAQKTALATKYKDMISGLGLEADIDITDARNPFQVIESNT